MSLRRIGPRPTMMALSIALPLMIEGCRPVEQDYKVASVFTEMRNLAFTMNPEDLHIAKKNDSQIYAMFMEAGYRDTVVSLRCFSEGSISLLFSNGGGMIGIGEHEAARTAGLEFIESAGEYLPLAHKTRSFELPMPGKTRFYFLTFAGVYALDDNEEVLGNGSSRLSPLFYKGQDVITQARLLNEANGEHAGTGESP